MIIIIEAEHIVESDIGILIVVLGGSKGHQVVLHLPDEVVDLLLFLAEAEELVADSPKILVRRCEVCGYDFFKFILGCKVISEGVRFNLRFRPSQACELLSSKLTKL